MNVSSAIGYGINGACFFNGGTSVIRTGNQLNGAFGSSVTVANGMVGLGSTNADGTDLEPIDSYWYLYKYVKITEQTNVNVNCIGNISYTVDGREITVNHGKTCAITYFDGNNYHSVTPVKNSDGSYTFTVPAGVTDAILTVYGDLNGDGSLDISDITSLLKFLAADTNVRDEMISSGQVLSFLLNVDGDETGAVDISDVTQLLKILAGN